MWRRRMPWARVPLRRGTDRVQAWLTLVLVTTTLLAAPGAAWWAASTTYRGVAQAVAWDRQHRVPVVAVLVEDAAGPDGGAGPGAGTVPVRARWTGPDGAARSGMISAPAGTRAGSPVPIWLDDHGRTVPKPARRSPVADAMLAAVLAGGAVVAGLGGVRRIVVWRLDRRRLRSWEAQWQVVGPQWSRR
ncbi:Rv1733c family protein [Couchioplanes azureus]|uniref:Rv1733c family protein n=1 Tax=Couchioplanes caeruleus TaxID=56438 RepID=UPI00166F7333|nr:hypothetical protein [Couchioplanes caeruleus]GGQ48802.1 hypothetical protein GCM10010166_16380 [Couchioplanes caeruleus subsp. azureus]